MAKFKKGQSGNPKGRPKGSGRINDLRKILFERSDELIDTAIETAIAGDMTAMKMCLDRLLPTLKPQTLNVFVCATSDDFSTISLDEQIVNNINTSNLSLSEANDLLDVIEIKNKLADAEALDDRNVREKKWDEKCNIKF